MIKVCIKCNIGRNVKSIRYSSLICKRCSNKNKIGMKYNSSWIPSKEWREKVSKRMKGRVISDETKERIRLSSIKRWSSADEKLKQSKRRVEHIKRNGHPKGMLGKKHSQETRIIMSKNRKGRKKPKDFNKKVSGINNGMWGKSNPHGKGSWYIKKDGNKIWMRSTYEIKFAKWLDDRKLTWEYETKRFVLTDRTYCPDFWIKEWNRWIEIKGWFNEKHQETIKQFRELNPKEIIIVFTYPILKSLKVL